MDIRELLKRAQKLTVDNSPAILTAIAVTGTVTTAYLTGRATVKAVEILNEERVQQAYQGRIQIQHHDQILLTDREKAALVWKLYIPAVSTGLLTVTCIIGANHIGTRRAAAVAAAYTLSERAFDEYRNKVVEKLGDNKEQALRDELAQDKVTRNPGNSSQLVIVDGKSVLCHEAYTGRYFICDMETLRKAQNDINFQVNNDYYASLTDFYEKIGLAATSISDEVGWNADKLLNLKFSTTMSEDGRPCIVIDYAVAPVRDYHRLS